MKNRLIKQKITATIIKNIALALIMSGVLACFITIIQRIDTTLTSDSWIVIFMTLTLNCYIVAKTYLEIKIINDTNV